MNKAQLAKIRNQISKIGKVSQDTLGTWPGHRFENPRPFKWLHE